jgi:hypothetical protein
LRRLAAMLCIEANDERLVGRRYISDKPISLVLAGRDDHRRRWHSSKRPEAANALTDDRSVDSYTTSRDLT